MTSLFKSSRSAIGFATALTILSATASATTFSFTTDPFQGTTATTTPGRQIVGNESFITFSIGSDVFSFEPSVFGIAGPIVFANAVVGSLPTSGLNAIVLQTLDNDANSGTAFGAGNAANLIADQITSPGAGFFIYFNQGLDRPRLVYSTDLNDNTADLKILARLTNLVGQAGRDALPTFTAADFVLASGSPVPERGSILALLLSASALLTLRRLVQRRETQS